MVNGSPIFIGFGNQKGGVGKTTLSELTASLLHYDIGYNVFAVDCDTGQHSFLRLREKETDKVFHNAALASQLSEYLQKAGKSAYNVHAQPVKDAIAFSVKECAKEHYDAVIFDLPGRLDGVDLLMLILDLDHLIVPVEMDRQSLHTSLSFAITVNKAKSLYPDTRLKSIFILWNKVKSSVRKDIIVEYNAQFRDELGLDVFDATIADLTRFRYGIHDVQNLSEAFRSTFVAPRLGARSSTGLNDFMRELLDKFFNRVLDNEQ